MAKTKITAAEYFKAINMIYYFMLGGQILLGAMGIYMVKSGFLEVENDLLYDVMLIVVSLYFVIGMTGSYLYFKKRLAKTAEMKNFLEKTAHYRGSLVVQYAMVEGIALFAIVGFMFTGSTMLLAILVVTIVYFIMLKPSREKMASELNLTPAEVSLIRNPDSAISEFEATY
ncbi:MAG: hypothetical protein ACFCU6_08970 [Balneolaceae bacterium]